MKMFKKIVNNILLLGALGYIIFGFREGIIDDDWTLVIRFSLIMLAVFFYEFIIRD